MLLVGGNDEMKYEVGSSTVHSDFVGILPNGQKCLPQHDITIPSTTVNCDKDLCVGVAFASKKGRWIYRCGGKTDSDTCEKCLKI